MKTHHKGSINQQNIQRKPLLPSPPTNKGRILKTSSAIVNLRCLSSSVRSPINEQNCPWIKGSRFTFKTIRTGDIMEEMAI